MPTTPPAPRSLGELRRSGYCSRPVREELRANPLARLSDGKRICEDVLGSYLMVDYLNGRRKKRS